MMAARQSTHLPDPWVVFDGMLAPPRQWFDAFRDELVAALLFSYVQLGGRPIHVLGTSFQERMERSARSRIHALRVMREYFFLQNESRALDFVERWWPGDWSPDSMIVLQGFPSSLLRASLRVPEIKARFNAFFGDGPSVISAVRLKEAIYLQSVAPGFRGQILPDLENWSVGTKVLAIYKLPWMDFFQARRACPSDLTEPMLDAILARLLKPTLDLLEGLRNGTN